MNVYDVMKEKNIVLPEPPPKGGVYAPCKISGNMAYISGCGCIIDGCEASGKLGREYQAAGLIVPTDEEMEAFVKQWNEAGFTNVKIGG